MHICQLDWFIRDFYINFLYKNKYESTSTLMKIVNVGRQNESLMNDFLKQLIWLIKNEDNIFYDIRNPKSIESWHWEWSPISAAAFVSISNEYRNYFVDFDSCHDDTYSIVTLPPLNPHKVRCHSLKLNRSCSRPRTITLILLTLIRSTWYYVCWWIDALIKFVNIAFTVHAFSVIL